MKNTFSFMQVINITPDSFSDGGKYNHIEGVVKKIEEAIQWKAGYIDLGAQSTAPMNQSISLDQELNRFEEIFYPVLKAIRIPPSLGISIDTYYVEVFKEVYGVIRKYFPENPILFNDVSGVIDEQLLALMKEKKDFFYVYCHSNVGKRENSNQHMNHVIDCTPKEIIAVLKQYFNDGLEQFNKDEMYDRIILDPAFGFAKNFEQNWELIHHLSELIETFSQTFLLGISKKSFLKNMIQRSSLESSEESKKEYLHASVLTHWFHKINKKTIIRGHDPAVFWASQIVTIAAR